MKIDPNAPAYPSSDMQTDGLTIRAEIAKVIAAGMYANPNCQRVQHVNYVGGDAEYEQRFEIGGIPVREAALQEADALINELGAGHTLPRSAT